MGGTLPPTVTHHAAAAEDRLTELEFFLGGEVGHVLNLLQPHQTNAGSPGPFPLRSAGQREQKFMQ